jgi:hypothetical protein
MIKQIIFIVATALGYSVAQVEFEQGIFTTLVDPFDQANENTFDIRFWKYDGYWNTTKTGPIFIYLCGEWICETPTGQEYWM